MYVLYVPKKDIVNIRISGTEENVIGFRVCLSISRLRFSFCGIELMYTKIPVKIDLVKS